MARNHPLRFSSRFLCALRLIQHQTLKLRVIIQFSNIFMLIFPYIHTVSKVATELSCETLKLKNCETFVISNGEFALPSTERVSRYATSKNAVHVVCENQVKIFFSVNRWPWLRSKVRCNFIRFNWILPSKISHKLKELFELVWLFEGL